MGLAFHRLPMDHLIPQSFRPFRCLIFLVVALIAVFPARADEWESEFRSPPPETRLRCYWYWMDGVFTKEGITRDLESMKRVGIGEAYIGIIADQGGPGAEKGMKALSDPWWDHLAHAVREGTRLGVDIGLFNSPGWSQSGGPWVLPSASMRHLVSAESQLTGPGKAGKVALPADPAFQLVSVLAWPTPDGDRETILDAGGKFRREGAALLWESPEPYTVRSITVRPEKETRTRAEYQVSEDGKSFRTIRSFAIDRHRLGVGVGPVPLAPVVASVPPTTSRFHRLLLAQDVSIGTADLSRAPRIDSIAEKSLAKMFQDPLPPFDFYSWPPQPEPEAPDLAIDPSRVINLTGRMNKDGSLDWQIPNGQWTVSVTGMVPTGARNGPAPAEATGLEVDKMNRQALAAHFDAYVGELYRRLQPEERKSWKRVVADSYEMGPQNWTDDFEQQFRGVYGYDPVPWLPVLSGRIIGTADQSNRFLWDLRRLVAERVASEYVGGLRDLCHEKGLRMWLENYGHWGFPSEFLLYGGFCDEISGEFWESGSLGEVELRAAASAAHIYNKKQVFAEAWTGGPDFTSTPWSLKKRGDWALTEGINQFVLHVYIHQPWEDRKPGVNAWFGTEFNRHNTWFEASKSWMDYHRRCTVLLQKGLHVADVAYFIGEDAPKMTGLIEPALPHGYDFDFINSDVLLRHASAKDGFLELSHGTRYRVLVLPPGETMRPALLGKIDQLARAGVKVIGPRPSRAPGLQDFPRADEEVRRLASGLWDSGLIRDEKDLTSVLRSAGSEPDVSGLKPSEVRFIHRRDGERHVYFLCNQTDRSLDIKPVFRVQGLVPEFWDPVTGNITQSAIHASAGKGTLVPLRLEPRASIFVVFRSPDTGARAIELTHDGKTILAARPDEVPGSPELPGSPGITITAWVKPQVETSLPKEANSGISAMGDTRNEIMAPAHGDSLGAKGRHAGVGLAVGTNGVVVYEHGGGYFAPVLVHPCALPDWTHVAVIYRDHRPHLYLNGKLARTGLQGPLEPLASPFLHTFGGGLRDLRSLDRAMNEAVLREWAAQRPQENPFPEQLVVAPNGGLSLLTSRAGAWQLRRADGKLVEFQTEAARVHSLDGPWSLRFPFQNENEPSFVLDHPASWTSLPDSRSVYHSGHADITTTFTLPDGDIVPGQSIFLDLGEVASLAEVSLNGSIITTLWGAPWRMDVTDRVKAGENTLHVRVWNTWHNRLLARHLRIPDLLPPAPHVTSEPRFPGGKSPLPSGLLGPVRLLVLTHHRIP